MIKNISKQQKKFLSEENQKKLDQQAEKAIIDGNKDAGVADATARLRAKELMDPDRTEPLTDPNQSEEDSAAQLSQQGIDEANDAYTSLQNSDIAKANANTKKRCWIFWRL